LKALLLAAGLGTRLRPLTDTVPKCLVPIRGKPLLDYWLDHLLGQGIAREVRINTHHLADRVIDHVAQSRWRERIELVHEEALLGTGGTVLANREWLGRSPFLVVHADNLTDAHLGDLVAAHHAADRDILLTLLAFRTDRPRDCGILELDAGGRVTAFHEKVEHPPGDLANGAVYVFAPEVLDHLGGIGKSVIDLSTEVIPVLLPRVQARVHSGFFKDIGSPDALREAEALFPGRP
jgi:mannose-1-phosphate guanylyltransferase